MLTGDHFRRVEFQGLVDMATPTWSISGSIDGLEFSPECASRCPTRFARSCWPSGFLRGQGNLRFKWGTIRQPPQRCSSNWPADWRKGGWTTRASSSVDRNPRRGTRQQRRLRDRRPGGRSGQATLRMACRRAGFEADSPLTLTAEVRQLELDRPLLDICPSR